MGYTRYAGDPFVLKTKFASKCHGCGAPIAKGEDAFYYPKGKYIYGMVACKCGQKNKADFESHAVDEDVYNGRYM